MVEPEHELRFEEFVNAFRVAALGEVNSEKPSSLPHPTLRPEARVLGRRVFPLLEVEDTRLVFVDFELRGISVYLLKGKMHFKKCAV